MQILENLTSAEGYVPEEILEAKSQSELQNVENDYFSCLQSQTSGIALSNLSEYMMSTLIDKISDT